MKLIIRTDQADIGCDVCGRTLLRGEHAEPFLAAGSPKTVCELCTLRAQHGGWVRETLVDGEPSAPRRTRGESRGSSLLERWRVGRKRGRNSDAGEIDLIFAEGTDQLAEPYVEVEEAHPAPTSLPLSKTYRERQVRAVPASLDHKFQRAVELFNNSTHPRKISGVARSLGEPKVCVRLRSDEPGVAVITVMWELSWYRFEVDLSDRGADVCCDGQGSELDELVPEERGANATVNERGHVLLAIETSTVTNETAVSR